MGKAGCSICGGKTRPFLTRKNVPVHQNLVCDTREEALNVTRGDLTLVECECGFVFNETFDASLLSYGSNYNNDQMASTFFDEYVDSIVDYLCLRNQTVVEIGCGKGDFLRKLAKHNTCIGYDPSYTGELREERVSFVQGYYNFPLPCDWIVCRHVIEHLADPTSLILNAPNIFFETPSLEWIVENDAWWDFFYEHCNYFTARTLEMVFALRGYTGNVEKHFGGQYLWYNGHLGRGS